ncbi:MAG: Rieske 2Fe-2S domain-containing protein [Candidatus Kapaibacterium sp.]
MKKERREFLKKGGLLGLGILGVSAAFQGCAEDEVVSLPPPNQYDVNLNNHPELLDTGGMAQVNIVLENGSQKNISIKRDSDTEFTVLDSLCRHQNCIVNLPNDETGGDLICPCHEVLFSFETGAVTNKRISDPVPDLIELEYDFNSNTNILKVTI